jgi:hypothetical protein
VLVDTIPLNVVAAADTHFLIVNLYDATGATHYDHLKIHVPIDELVLLNIGHCKMEYSVWGIFALEDNWAGACADCDVSFDPITGLFSGTWNVAGNVGSIYIEMIDASNEVDSIYFQATNPYGRGPYEMVCMHISYVIDSPFGAGPCYYLEGNDVCDHTTLLNHDDCYFGVMESYACIPSGFYMSMMYLRFTE